VNASPDVSVIMPTWNRTQFLRASIEAVLTQTVPIRELIIADDGSEAPAREMLEQYASRPGIRVLWRSHCGRPAAVRNAALREAAGRYIAFADSDDVWHAEKLARQLETLQSRPGCRWSFGAWSSIDADGRALAIPVPDYRRRTGSLVDRVARLSISIALPSVLAERSLLFEAGLFEETLDCYEDYDLWLRLAALAEAAIVFEPLVQVRWHDRRFSRVEPVVSLRNRIQYFERAERQVREPAVRAELQRKRALDSARLANLVARSGDVGDVSSLLRESLANGWTNPRWWLIAAQAHSRLWSVRSRSLRESP
jgi:glycosyltransferase involved in cell wall biosynthesis